MSQTRIIWEPTSAGLTGYFAQGVLGLSRAYEYPPDGGPGYAVGWYVLLISKQDDEPRYLVPPVGQGEAARWLAGGKKNYFLSVGDALRAAQAEVQAEQLKALGQGGNGEKRTR